MKKEELVACFEKAKRNCSEVVGVVVEIYEDRTSELILNKKDNFDNKLKYYKESYDDNLNHKKGPARIIGAFISEGIATLDPEYFGDTSHWGGNNKSG